MTIKSISILIPTYNEAENIAGLLIGVRKALEPLNIPWEVVVVDDDSQDNTADIAQKAMGERGRVIRRRALKKSLSLSVLDGIQATKNDAILVMDADGSHPPALIPEFIAGLNQGYDLVIGSRYVKGGGTKDFPLTRRIISRIACLIAGMVTPVKDNTSGFFSIRRAALDGRKLAPSGFKIGLEVFVKAKFRSFKEIPFIFVNRKKGKSKLGPKATLQFLYQIISLLRYKAFNPRCPE